MKRVSIPNEVVYRIQIPASTIFRFQGEGRYEETLEDHFRYCIVQPLVEQQIHHQFNFFAIEVADGFGMELRVDGTHFEEYSIVGNLENEGLLMGLVVTKLAGDGWLVVYDDARRSKYLKRKTK